MLKVQIITILKQQSQINKKKKEFVCFTLGIWNDTYNNYSTIKKEILAIINTITKFIFDLLCQKFLLKIDSNLRKKIIFKILYPNSS